MVYLCCCSYFRLTNMISHVEDHLETSWFWEWIPFKGMVAGVIISFPAENQSCFAFLRISALPCISNTLLFCSSVLALLENGQSHLHIASDMACEFSDEQWLRNGPNANIFSHCTSSIQRLVTMHMESLMCSCQVDACGLLCVRQTRRQGPSTFPGFAYNARFPGRLFFLSAQDCLLLGPRTWALPDISLPGDGILSVYPICGCQN